MYLSDSDNDNEDENANSSKNGKNNFEEKLINEVNFK